MKNIKKFIYQFKNNIYDLKCQEKKLKRKKLAPL